MDLYTACTLNHPKVTDLLSTNLNKANKKGWTGLMYACYYGHENLVDRIINIDPTTLFAINNDKQTPLMIATMSGNTSIVKKTFHTTVLEMADKLGRTAMFYAVLYNQENILEYFIEKQANCNVIDKFGKTMTMTAIAKGFIRIMKILSEYGNRQEDGNLNEWKNKYETAIPTDRQQNDDHPNYHMEKLLKQLSLEKYWPIFDKQNIRYDDFLKLSEQDLKNIGINLFGPRRKLIMTIDKLNELRTLQEHSRS
ncbi:Sterile alpha motif/pointed domain,Sterile alpha motif domain,Ankyrin repeat-containing domain,Ankyrin [Cinara cedri]|uniref:Sterile alpha motif/pointed domain,Sterile alpha motif domain,Ankyrin repeat-containing domain,Ankyrin n=1 Tax=Cinara cedri TaxID=506608 RepID=A0A5E4M254_9HEMI|nr:Sterile alpha motif/pointed domain,Sterile alpha motif domain,Ankyrin repeat-containing domain,Ankyrin [Cinara cedri]